ncbi:MAG: LysM peptidoglycan-binding domain-containing protein, partial [Acidimicrobiia bacterium]|nr:LysM peptidoglycan-binding domain-containing protein [Acidimicrobiia bacterium]
ARRQSQLPLQLPAPTNEVVPVPNVVAPSATTTPPIPSVAPTTAVYTGYTVQAGDNLWLIAENHVAATTGGAPTVAAITSYWRQVVEVNRQTLRSGDPNMIFAGEIIVIPAMEVTP